MAPQWEVVSADAQVLSIHATLMPTNEILYFGGDEHSKAQHKNNQIDNTRLFNVSTGLITTLTSPTTDVFCSGHAFLGDGRLLVAGGTETWLGVAGEHGHGAAGHFTGHRACWVYDPHDRGWTRVADMRPQPGFEATNEGGGRWYPTLLTLPDGRVLAVSGHPSRTDRRHTNTSPELYSAGTNAWSVINPTQVVDSPYYPRLHLLPSGNVFFASPVNGANRVYNPTTGVFVGPPITLPGDGLYNGWGATSVLLPLLPGDGYKPRVLVCGAQQPRRINLSDASPSWRDAGTRTGAAAGRVREHLCAVILPTGEVFLSGGVSVVNPENPVLHGEIYSPGIDWTTGTYAGTERWASTEEPAHVPRNYHSVALLMPNGRVWTAGSSKNASEGDPAIVGEMRIEVYKPWYDADPNRPRIISSPSSIRPGQTFEVQTPQASNIRRVALIRAGSVTHAFDSDQRYVGLNFRRIYQTDRLSVTAPPDGSIAPPGHYMLWIVDNAGRPCAVARFVHVRSHDVTHDVFPDWQQLDNNPATTEIVAASGNLYQRHSNGFIWRYTGTPLSGWELLDNNPASTEIVGAGGNLYQLHNNGLIWRYTGTPLSGWELLDNNPATVQIAAGGSNLYQIHDNGNIWKYTGPPLTGWRQLDNNPASVTIVAADNNLYQMHNNGLVYRYFGS
jgi:hypothetical protein